MSGAALGGALLGGAITSALMLISRSLIRLAQPRLVTRVREATGLEAPRNSQGFPALHVRLVRHPQLVPLALGVLGGAFAASVFIARGASPLLMFLGPFLGGMAAHFLVGHNQARQRKAHERAIARELPTVLELLALAVAGGESFPAALERVSTVSGGPVGRGAYAAAREMAMGAPWERTLREWAATSQSSDLERFVDRVVISLERGTPMADVLRAQAVDARVRHRNSLVELAGRKDVAMLIPVVFLILPTVVVIALFPGARAISVLTG